MQERDIDRLAFMAAKNIKKGVIEEPRVYYDVLELESGNNPPSSALVVRGDSDAFRNQEQFPVRITHLASQLLWRQPVAGGDVLFTQENKIQGIGLRFEHHDEYYMGSQLLPAPQWGNQYTSQTPNTTQSAVSWQLPCPVILSARDSLRIELGSRIDPRPLFTLGDEGPTFTSEVLVSVSVTGIGALSHRPYFFGSQTYLPFTAGQTRLLDPRDFRNNGAEPVILTDMVLSCPGFSATWAVAPDTFSALLAGSPQLFDVQIRQQGNGTNADWFRGPSTPIIRPRCPAGLLGFNGGRAIIHRLPGDGLIWEPGDGAFPEAIALASGLTEDIGQDTYEPYIAVAAMGYMSVV